MTYKRSFGEKAAAACYRLLKVMVCLRLARENPASGLAEYFQLIGRFNRKHGK